MAAACRRGGAVLAANLRAAALDEPSALRRHSGGLGWLALRDQQHRDVSQMVNKANGKRAFLVDTLALVRRLESHGIESKHAEAITSAITEVLNDSLENVAQSFVSQGEMQKVTKLHPGYYYLKAKAPLTNNHNVERIYSIVELALMKKTATVASEGPSNTKGTSFSLLQRETEKFKNDIEKMRSELRYEIDKVTAGQRLDLNLERGRIRDELAKQNAETYDLTNKIDREIHSLKAQLEAAKYDVIKYCIGTLVSIAAVSLATIRILM